MLPRFARLAGNLPLFPFLISILLGFVCIVMSRQPLMWSVLEMGTIAGIVSVPILVYARVPLPFFLLCVFVFCLPLDISKAFTFYVNGEESVKYISPRDFLATLMTLAWLFDVALHKKRKIYLNRIWIPYLSFVVWSEMSMVNALKPHLTLLHLTTYFKWFGIYLTVANILNTRERLQIVLWILCLSLFLQGGYVVAQKITGSTLELMGQKATAAGRGLDFGTGIQQIVRPSGSFHHPNVLATYMVQILPLLIVQLFNITQPFKKVILSLGVGFGLVSLLFSYSRGGWLSFILAGGIILFFSLKKKLIEPKTIAGMALVFAMVAGILFPYWQSFLWRFTKSDNSSGQTRIVMLKQSWLMAARNPLLGIGLGNYAESSFDYLPEESLLLRTAPKGYIAHNRFAVMMAETGFVGLALFLWLHWEIFRVALWNIRIQDPWACLLSIGLLAGYVGTLFGMMFDHFSDSTRTLLFWFFISLIYAIQNHFRKPSPSPEKIEPAGA